MEQQDFLTCGDCQLVFTLSNIVAFVRHKQTVCHRDIRRKYQTTHECSSEPDDNAERCRDVIGSDVDNEEFHVVEANRLERRTSSAGRRRFKYIIISILRAHTCICARPDGEVVVGEGSVVPVEKAPAH